MNSSVCTEPKTDLRGYRRALGSFATGVAVITAGAGLWLLLRPSGKRAEQSRTSRVVPFVLPNGLGLGVSGAL